MMRRRDKSAALSYRGTGYCSSECMSALVALSDSHVSHCQTICDDPGVWSDPEWDIHREQGRGQACMMYVCDMYIHGTYIRYGVLPLCTLYLCNAIKRGIPSGCSISGTWVGCEFGRGRHARPEGLTSTPYDKSLHRFGRMSCTSLQVSRLYGN